MGVEDRRKNTTERNGSAEWRGNLKDGSAGLNVGAWCTEFLRFSPSVSAGTSSREADHVAAVSTIATESRSLLSSSFVGALWGLGQTISLLVMRIAVILLHYERTH
jgi:hypothetical protein